MDLNLVQVGDEFDFVREAVALMTALGFPREKIVAVLEKYGVVLTVAEVAEIQEKEEELIKRKRYELKRELDALRANYSLPSKVATIIKDAQAILQEVKEKKKYREYAQVLSGLLRSLEILNKALEADVEGPVLSDEEFAEADFKFVKRLEALGLVKVLDEEGLREYLLKGVDYDSLE